MKKQIRRGVFETNSSSVHSLTMCSQDEYSKWGRGELYLERHGDTFYTREELIEMLKTEKQWNSNELLYSDVNWDNKDEVDALIKECEYYTEEEYWNDVEDEYETFHDTYTTPSKETVVAFGYYGEDR